MIRRRTIIDAKTGSVTKVAGKVGDALYGVTTLKSKPKAGGSKLYRRKPCEQCPWVKSREGVFPPDAYRISANTAEDMATHTFACHMAGSEKPQDCAGFLLRGGTHNMSVRLAAMRGDLDMREVSDGGDALYANYREMAVANGVPADDPALARCRDDV